MKSIIVDMDNVMANITELYCQWFEKRTGTRVDPASLVGKPEVDGFPDPELVRSFLYTPGFFRSAPVMAGSQEVLYELSKRFDVFIVSAAMEFPQSLNEKFEWLAEHFPFITWKQVVFCGSKSVIRGDYMIDDYLRNLESFGGKRILFTAPHNQLLEGHLRMDTWKDLERYFKTEAD